MSENLNLPLGDPRLLNWGELTHRQFVAWQAYYLLSLNSPSRADYYQMQTALILARVNSKTPDAVRFDQFRLSFSSKTDSIGETDEEFRKRVTDHARETMAARFGGWDAVTVLDANGNVVKRPTKNTRGLPPNPMLRPSGIDPTSSVPPITRKRVPPNGYNPRTGTPRDGLHG